ncbi:hypothetical protein [Salipiger sp. PrR002]|uniref:hypothetical protein n=1 Tax=Salipiger sp. PrR002 TaxID=2706489 RepID=UPI0013B60DB8|nr:hypothetical protein [Salipiger sp. PrR002]NDW02124.1 hypothetical protein [Salipiger sp. PrR002]NDW59300.1 hypothetical protein [Salipiger sp. PrR004]
MAFADHPTLYPTNWLRDLHAQVPRKFVRDLMNRWRYGAEAPMSDELIHVDPMTVNHLYTGSPKMRRRQSGMVVPGDWDLKRRPVEDHIKLISCRMHFEGGTPWRDTPLFQKLLDEINQGGVPDECATEEDLVARYERLDQVFEETRRRGRLLARTELPEYFRREHGGILVHVGRDGTLLRASGGAHRFAISRILRLPKIPAQLGVVHPQALADGLLRQMRQP